MSKCETCIHYEYKAGIDQRLAKQMGYQDWPSQPMCYCNYTHSKWIRRAAEVRKPTGMPCQYEPKIMTCNECGGHNTRGAFILSSRSGEMVCKKCMDKHRKEREQKEAAHDERTWLYIKSEPCLWTVGFFDPGGRWNPESDHGTPDEAAERVHWLNGGHNDDQA